MQPSSCCHQDGARSAIVVSHWHLSLLQHHQNHGRLAPVALSIGCIFCCSCTLDAPSTPPAVYLAVCLACCFAGQSDKITQTLKDKFWPTLLAGYAVWPLAHVINFRFIPNSQRVLYINAVNVSFLVYHTTMYNYTCVSRLMCLHALDIPHLYCDTYCLFLAYLTCGLLRHSIASVRGFVIAASGVLECLPV